MLRIDRMRWHDGEGNWEETDIVPQELDKALADARQLGAILILKSDAPQKVAYNEVWLHPGGTWTEILQLGPRIETDRPALAAEIRKKWPDKTPGWIAAQLSQSHLWVIRLLRENPDVNARDSSGEGASGPQNEGDGGQSDPG